MQEKNRLSDSLRYLLSPPFLAMLQRQNIPVIENADPKLKGAT
jgi:hypothetical protein